MKKQAVMRNVGCALLLSALWLPVCYGYATYNQQVLHNEIVDDSLAPGQDPQSGLALFTDDPYETYNRHAFALNKGLDTALFKPVASIYHYAIPWPIRKGVTNFFNNLDEIPSFANSLLQLNVESALISAWRFAVNSTIGVFGVVDVAAHMGLAAQFQDFGLTLGAWGYKNSTYLVLPIFGPSTVRDTIGIPADYYLSIYPHINSPLLRNSMQVMKRVSFRSDLLQVENLVDAVSLDRYVFERDAYLQRRNARLHGKLANSADTELYIDDDAGFGDSDLYVDGPETLADPPKVETVTEPAKAQGEQTR